MPRLFRLLPCHDLHLTDAGVVDLVSLKLLDLRRLRFLGQFWLGANPGLFSALSSLEVLLMDQMVLSRGWSMDRSFFKGLNSLKVLIIPCCRSATAACPANFLLPRGDGNYR